MIIFNKTFRVESAVPSSGLLEIRFIYCGHYIVNGFFHLKIFWQFSEELSTITPSFACTILFDDEIH